MEKSANKRWRESGTTLPFKEWITREDEKKSQSEQSFVSLDASKTFNTGYFIKEQIDTSLNTIDLSVPVKEQKYVEKPDTSKILGLDKNVLIFSSLLLVGSLSFYFYKRFKNKG